MRWQKMTNQWEMLDENLRKRHSLIPILVETFRQHEQNEKLVAQLVAHRLRAAKEYGIGAKKIEYEHDLSHSLNIFFELGRKHSLLSKDTAFLSLDHEVASLESMMQEQSKGYNDLVRLYNRNMNSFFLFLIAKMFGYKRANIFDIES